MRARARPAVRILRDPSCAAPAYRQAARRDERRAGEAVEGDRRARRRKRRARPAAAHARRGADARARARMRGGAVLAVDRHRRQPPVDARAARRRGARRRRVRAARSGRVDRRAAWRPLHRAHRRRRAGRDRRHLRDQQRGARRTGARAPHAGPRSALGAAALFRARQLFQPVGPCAVLAPDLSDARSRGARRAPDARSWRAGALRPGRRVVRFAALRSRSGARGRVLHVDPRVLAGLARRCAAAGVRGHPAEARGARRAAGRLHRAGGRAARRARAREPVRHRVAGAHRVARARAAGGRHGVARMMRGPRPCGPAARNPCEIPYLRHFGAHIYSLGRYSVERPSPERLSNQ
ncbi:hypothetical protein F01_420737 [Burkholderia cenocepacia]|nr:hypothetical protein F01_420737 [Burkholderia cenocepacia]